MLTTFFLTATAAITGNNQLRTGLGIGLIELGLGLRELGIGLIELRIGLMELGIAMD